MYENGKVGFFTMKKFIALILVLTTLFALMAPCASAVVVNEDRLPIIYIRGNGEKLVNGEGKPVAADLKALGGLFGESEDEESEGTKDAIVEATMNILTPFIVNGLIFDDWEDYGQAIYDEISPLFKEGILDGNGDPQYGTQVTPSRLDASIQHAKSTYGLNTNNKGDALGYYYFCYDWRLSPYDHVDRLHEYVKLVMQTTGKSQVCLYTICFGGSLLNAYLERYGHLGHVKRAMYSEALGNGADVVSESFSGKIRLNDITVQRYLKQLERCGEFGVGQGIVFTDIVDEIAMKTIDTANQLGITAAAFGGVENLYAKLYKALIPAICFASGIATQPNYWACVKKEDFADAMKLMFGEEGSKARTYYAGLIEKIQFYYDHVTSKGDELYKKFNTEYGVGIGITAKYGYINLPLIESYDVLCDALVGLEDASLGATCAKVGKTLPQEYIDARIAEGKGKYISPDKQVDTSTCLFPETTWIIKNAHHNFFQLSDAIAYDFLRSENLTVETSQISRFNVFYEETKTWEAMTEENCADFDWITAPVEEPTEATQAFSIIRWLTIIFKVVVGILKGEIKFKEIGDFVKKFEIN